MIMYHTIQLRPKGGGKTHVLDLETKEEYDIGKDIYATIDDFNKKGYYLTAVNGIFYYLTKRKD
jgi:hypothetical protein